MLISSRPTNGRGHWLISVRTNKSWQLIKQSWYFASLVMCVSAQSHNILCKDRWSVSCGYLVKLCTVGVLTTLCCAERFLSLGCVEKLSLLVQELMEHTDTNKSTPHLCHSHGTDRLHPMKWSIERQVQLRYTHEAAAGLVVEVVSSSNMTRSVIVDRWSFKNWLRKEVKLDSTCE